MQEPWLDRWTFVLAILASGAEDCLLVQMAVEAVGR